MKRPFAARLLLWLLVLAALLVPRLLALDHFVNSDERKWLARSANFYTALVHGDWASTFQKEHPGVTVMWAGAAGFAWRYPAYAWDTIDRHFSGEDEGLETFLQTQGYRPLDLLLAGRIFMVLGGVLALLLAYWIAMRLLGVPTATLGFLLIAFNPFHIALARMLHVDGLEANWMFLALLAWLAYLRQGKRRDLVISALAAGLAWLTKVPSLFLVPFVGLTVLLELGITWRQTRHVKRTELLRLLRAAVVWGLIGLGVVFAIWPAMWVAPVNTLRTVIQHAFLQADGHGNATYFNGQVIERWGNTGPIFYPVTYLWRTTPVTLIGLLLAGLAFLFSFKKFALRRVAGYLTLFALCFLLFMTIGTKRFDRYLLPIYPALDLVAAIGWMALLGWLANWWPRRANKTGAALLTAGLVAGQAALLLPIYPHFMSYYNPLLGGGAKAPAVMMIGWGEGLDEAARYLNAKPDAAQLQVAAWYTIGGFSYFFDGRSVPLAFERMTDINKWLDLDYAVTYIHQWQRRLPDPRLLDYLAQFTPERVIQLNGIDYAEIYNLRTMPPPPYLGPGRTPRYVDWDGAIRLLGYQMPITPLPAGTPFVLTFDLQNRAPIARNLNVLVRVVGADGTVLLQDEGWPWGSPTTSWQVGEIWQDGHHFSVPTTAAAGFYRVEMSFYDPATLDGLPAVDAYTQAVLAPVHVVDYVTIGTPTVAPAQPFTPTWVLGDQVQLVGTDLDPAPVISGGTTLPVRLYWQAQRGMATDYTSFVHLIGPDNTLVAQQDLQPQASFLATHLWQPGDRIAINYQLSLPTSLPAGQYTLHAGMYDAAGTRLPVRQGDQPTGDTAQIAEIKVQ